MTKVSSTFSWRNTQKLGRAVNPCSRHLFWSWKNPLKTKCDCITQMSKSSFSVFLLSPWNFVVLPGKALLRMDDIFSLITSETRLTKSKASFSIWNHSYFCAYIRTLILCDFWGTLFESFNEALLLLNTNRCFELWFFC